MSSRASLRSSFVLVACGLLLAPGAFAQELTELCPGATDASSAVVGVVQDADSGMILPGAEVWATWTADGEPGRTTASVAMDGTFTLCGVPRGAAVSLRAVVAGRGGEAVELALGDPVVRQDLDLSLATAQPVEAAQMAAAEEGGGRGSSVSSALLTEKDLAELPPMTVFDLLSRHSRIRIDRTGADQRLFVEDRSTMGTAGGASDRWRRADVYLNGRRDIDPLGTVRLLRIEDVKRIEILTSTEASSRFGGDGYTPIIAIQKK